MIGLEGNGLTKEDDGHARTFWGEGVGNLVYYQKGDLRSLERYGTDQARTECPSTMLFIFFLFGQRRAKSYYAYRAKSIGLPPSAFLERAMCW